MSLSSGGAGRGRWCNRCKAVHPSACPDAPVWAKPIKKDSGRGGRPWRRKRELIFKRDNFLCQICLQNDVLTAVSLSGADAGVCDHIMALAHGGSDDNSNLQTICKSCDKTKSHAESMRGRGGSIS